MKTKQSKLEHKRNVTLAESMMWQELRDSKTGYKFFRQYGVGQYVLDFYCLEKKLGIELDGGGERDAETKQYDKSRKNFLEGQGILMLRFWNGEVENDRKKVLETILRRLT